ncbi:MAG: hypothetical protein QW041_00325 [Candidatus Pacearchaeota archaeon]
MKNILKSKKAAIEMSMTTVIVIVLSVIMLILGLTLLRTISCGALRIASTTLEGAQDEINKLFGEEKGQEIVCMGTKQTFTIIPNKYNVVGCGFNPEVVTNYNYEYVIVSAISGGRDITAEVKTWIPERLSGTITAAPGEVTYATFGIQPPKNAPRTIIVIKPRINGIDKNMMRFEVKSVGWLSETIC